MYDSLKWNRRGLTDLCQNLTVQPKNSGLLSLIFLALIKPNFKICCHAVRPQRALGSCFPKAPSQNPIKKRFAQPETKVNGDWKEKDMKTERRAVKGRGCGEASKIKRRVRGGQKVRERRVAVSVQIWHPIASLCTLQEHRAVQLIVS